jgi:uncharacterized Fe-S radical SAM superfamily protein PflX
MLINKQAQDAKRSLAAFERCQLRCGANRLAGQPVPCGLSSETWGFRHHLSFAEEPELLPSEMVHPGGCNFRCRFCVQAPQRFDPAGGRRVEPDIFADELRESVRRGTTRAPRYVDTVTQSC